MDQIIVWFKTFVIKHTKERFKWKDIIIDCKKIFV